MRIFKSFTEAKNEIRRDLKEMGLAVANSHMQDKVGQFDTLELNNYGYTVLAPREGDLTPTTPWCHQEWTDRLAGIYGNASNPGTAFRTRKDKFMNWDEFLENNGEPVPLGAEPEELGLRSFSYTYSERFALKQQVMRIIWELKKNPLSRQLYISMWDPTTDSERIGYRRVPCSLGWHFLYRENALHMTYTMRSCDFATHFDNDCWLAFRLQEFIARAAHMPVGRFSHFINSFHVYTKDVADVF